MSRLKASERRLIPANLARLLLPLRAEEDRVERMSSILSKLSDADIKFLWNNSRVPGNPALARREKVDSKAGAAKARKILVDGLKYHEHDGHDMPKKVAREALEALGVNRDDQP